MATPAERRIITNGFGNFDGNGLAAVLDLAERSRAVEPQKAPQLSLDEYREGLKTGEIRQPRNAHQRVWEALMTPQPEVLASGLRRYPFFTEHPQHPVFGIYGTIEQIMDAIRAGRDSGGTDTGILLVGDSGTGKSEILKAIKTGFEESARTMPPVYGIAECRIQESPLNLFSLEYNARERAELHRHGIDIHPLCPDCQERFPSYDAAKSDARIVPTTLSVARGLGISKLEPRTTKNDGPNARARVDRRILESHGGILEISEFFGHDYDDFLGMTHDLFRGRNWQTEDGREFTLSNVIIAHTTTKEFNEHKDDIRFLSLLRRLPVIRLGYNLSAPDEARIYWSGIEKGGQLTAETGTEAKRTHRPHVPAKTMDVFANAGVLTRFNDEDEAVYEETPPDTIPLPSASREEKLDLYQGNMVDGIDSLAAEALMKTEQRYRGDGFRGVSPADMQAFVKETISRASDLQGCLDPVTAMDVIREAIDNQRIGIDYEALDILDEDVQAWVVDLIRKAAAPDYVTARQDKVKRYIATAKLVVTNEKVRDRFTGLFVDPDTTELEEIENNAFPPDDDGTVRPLSDEERYRLRGDIVSKVGILKNADQPEPPDYQHMPPWLQHGVDNTVFKSDLISRLVQMHGEENKLSPLAPQLAELQASMIANGGCCEHCVHVLLDYAKDLDLMEKFKSR